MSQPLPDWQKVAPRQQYRQWQRRYDNQRHNADGAQYDDKKHLHHGQTATRNHGTIAAYRPPCGLTV